MPPFHFLADLDGDGYLDLLAKFAADNFTGGPYPTPEMGKTEFYRNDGKGFFSRLPEQDYFEIHPQFLPLDVDGDGISDFVNPIWYFPGLPGTWSGFIKATGPPRTLFAATLPSSRSVQVGQAATFFATIINAGTTDASGCVIDKLSGVKGNLSFQATDPASNAPVGLPNTPVTIAAGGSQTFVVSVMPTAQFTSTEFAHLLRLRQHANRPISQGLEHRVVVCVFDADSRHRRAGRYVQQRWHCERRWEQPGREHLPWPR